MENKKEAPQPVPTGVPLWPSFGGGTHVGHPLKDGTYFKCGGTIDYAGRCTKCGKAVY